MGHVNVPLQWHNRLAHSTYRQYKRHAGVVSLCLNRGCSSVVERMLCMYDGYEAPGSIPGISTRHIFAFISRMAEVFDLLAG